MTRTRARQKTSAPTAAQRLLPASWLETPLAGLDVPADLAQRLEERSIRTLGDLLGLPARAFAKNGWLRPDGAELVRKALGAKLADNAPSENEQGPLHERFAAGLAPDEREVLDLVAGVGGTTMPRTAIAARLKISLQRLDERIRQVRARMHERSSALLGRLRYEAGRDLEAFDGVLDPRDARDDSLLATLGRETADRLLGARILAFCFPREFHIHAGLLCQAAPRRFRRLLRTLPRIVRPQRLPLSIDALRNELAAEQLEVPRGLLLHLLKKELRVVPDGDPALGEVAVADPRSAEKRLVDLMLEAVEPMRLDDVVFAWRERFRRASRGRIERMLRGSPSFLMLGPETWSLRDRHAKELLAAGPLAERMARRICAMGGRHDVTALLAEEKVDQRTAWLVLDRLAVDPRVRMLGRGNACPAAQRQSRVLEHLLADFRKAGGDVVLSLFVQNQPPELHRLVERLLRQNRLFVMPAPDRIDVLSNYPFDVPRLRRLVTIVDQQLQARSGYAPVGPLKAAVDGTDLGGSWLSEALLVDLLRRHGPFEVLPGDLVARRELGLGAFVMRCVRQALRDIGGMLTVDDILQQRPDLAEFAGSLRELLATDPLVQSPDGTHFTMT